MPASIIRIFSVLLYADSSLITNYLDVNSENAAEKIPMLIFFILCIVMAALSFFKNLSLIPVLGLLSCCYLLTGMTLSNWKWFFSWLLIGLVLYFSYSYKNSKLNKKPGNISA